MVRLICMIAIACTYKFIQSNQMPYKAVISVPVADLVGTPLSTLFPERPASSSYRSIPYSWAGSSYYQKACPRVHQALFNELVLVLEHRGDEAYIEVSSAYYVTRYSKIPHHRFWTLATNVTPLDAIANTDSIIKAVPPPIDFRCTTAPADSIATLVIPLTLKFSPTTFSAGTRFRIHATSKHEVTIIVPYYDDQHVDLIKIPRSSCMIGSPNSLQQVREHFVAVLRRWAHRANGSIPYTWGGTSYIHAYHKNMFTVRSTVTAVGDDYSWYSRGDLYAPKAGFDCSGLVLAAAHVCGIPYYLKNTYTISQVCKPLAPTDSLEIGDLFWITGHVMVVADLAANTIIESGPYEYGYGIVHEIPVGKLFEGIDTFDALRQALKQNQPLKRIDKTGRVLKTYHHYALYSLESALSCLETLSR